MARSYAEIQERIERGEAVVMTAQEVAELAEADRPSLLGCRCCHHGHASGDERHLRCPLLPCGQAGIISEGEEGLDQRRFRPCGPLSQRKSGGPGPGGLRNSPQPRPALRRRPSLSRSGGEEDGIG